MKSRILIDNLQFALQLEPLENFFIYIRNFCLNTFVSILLKFRAAN